MKNPIRGEIHADIEGLQHLEAAAQMRKRSLTGASATFYDERMRAEGQHIPKKLQNEYNQIIRESDQTRISQKINDIQKRLRDRGYDRSNMATIEKYRSNPSREMTRRRSLSRSRLFERAQQQKYTYDHNGKRYSKSSLRNKAAKKQARRAAKYHQEREKTEYTAAAKRYAHTEAIKRKARNLVQEAHANQEPQPIDLTIEPEPPLIDPPSPQTPPSPNFKPVKRSSRMLSLNDIDQNSDSAKPHSLIKSPSPKKSPQRSPSRNNMSTKINPERKTPVKMVVPRKPSPMHFTPPSTSKRVRKKCRSPPSPPPITEKANYVPSLSPKQQQYLYECTRAEAEQYRLRQSSSRLFGPDPSEGKPITEKGVTLENVFESMQEEKRFQKEQVENNVEEEWLIPDDPLQLNDLDEFQENSLSHEHQLEKPIDLLEKPASPLKFKTTQKKSSKPKQRESQHEKIPKRKKRTSRKHHASLFKPVPAQDDQPQHAFSQLLEIYQNKCKEAESSYREAVTRENQRYQAELSSLESEFKKALAQMTM